MFIYKNARGEYLRYVNNSHETWVLTPSWDKNKTKATVYRERLHPSAESDLQVKTGCKVSAVRVSLVEEEASEVELKPLDQIRELLTKHRMSPMHDYNDRGKFIERLGVWEETLEDCIRPHLPAGWITIERRRVQHDDGNFLRVDIVHEEDVETDGKTR